MVFREGATSSRGADLLPTGTTGAVVRFRDDASLDRMITLLSAEPAGTDRWTSKRAELAALRADRVMLIGSDRRLCDRMVALRAGGESFKDTFLYRRGPEETRHRDLKALWAVIGHRA